MATSEEIRLARGDSLKKQFTVLDAQGVAVDISGGGGAFTIALTPTSAALVAKTQGSGIAFVTDGTDGKIEVTLAPADTDTATTPAGVYYYEVAARAATVADQFTVARGRLVLEEAVIGDVA
jgi:hypothetical protein